MEKTTMSVQELFVQPKTCELVKTLGFPTIRIGAEF
jgi:hypothetical protein